ncbi:hypothetical protein [Azospirillum sp. sgz302134]
MQDESRRWEESRRELGILTATAVAGAIVSGVVIAGWWSLEAETAVAATDVVDQGLHNLSPAECRSTLSALLSQFRSDPRVLWVWVEQSVSAGSSHITATLGTSLSYDSPRPYAFRPDVAEAPTGVCGFENNSLHALSLGGAAGPFLEPPPDPMKVAVGP